MITNLYSPRNRKLVFDWLARNLKPVKITPFLAYCWSWVDEVLEDIGNWGSFEIPARLSKSGCPEVFDESYLEA
jgi:hypothetical protein